MHTSEAQFQAQVVVGFTALIIGTARRDAICRSYGALLVVEI